MITAVVCLFARIFKHGNSVYRMERSFSVHKLADSWFQRKHTAYGEDFWDVHRIFCSRLNGLWAVHDTSDLEMD